MGWNPFNSAKKKFEGLVKDLTKKAIRQIEDAAKDASRGVTRQAEDKIKGTYIELEKTQRGVFEKIKKAGKSAEKDLVKTSGKLKGELKTVGSDIQDNLRTFESNAEKIVKTTLEGMLKAVVSESFKKYVDWLQVFMPSKAGIRIGPVAFEYESLTERVDYLQTLAENPPTNKEGIIQLITTLTPTSVTVSASANFSAVVVNIEELGGEGWFVLETEDFIKKIDRVL